jgi:hypothetical protein
MPERHTLTTERNRRRTRPHCFGLIAAVLLATIACSETPPPRWAEAGASLRSADATWTQPEGDVIKLTRDGRVLADAEELFAIDATGHIFDGDREPLAMLEVDGRLKGTDKERLGRVGFRNASPPWTKVAWLHIALDGTVVVFGADNEPVYLGRWQGCEGPVLRTCTLVTHLVVLEALRRRVQMQEPPMMFGVGVWY